MFNHTMVYDGFRPADLRQACAELSLWDHGALASRQLGAVRLSLGTGKWAGPSGATNAGRQGLPEWPWAFSFCELWCQCVIWDQAGVPWDLGA